MLAEFDGCPGLVTIGTPLNSQNPANRFRRALGCLILTHFRCNRLSVATTSPSVPATGLSDFPKNRHEYRGLGYNLVLYLPRPRHNQDGERINSDEDAIGKDVVARHAGWALPSVPFVIVECQISWIHQRRITHVHQISGSRSPSVTICFGRTTGRERSLRGI